MKAPKVGHTLIPSTLMPEESLFATNNKTRVAFSIEKMEMLRSQLRQAQVFPLTKPACFEDSKGCVVHSSSFIKGKNVTLLILLLY